MNSHINTILVKWDSFFRYFRDDQVITMTTKNFHRILEIVDETMFVEMWNENTLNLVSSLFAARNIPVNIDNLLEYEYRPFGVLGGAFKEVAVRTDEEGYTIVIFIHQFGEKWSRVIESALAYQLSIYLKCHTRTSRTTSSVTITLLDRSIRASTFS